MLRTTEHNQLEKMMRKKRLSLNTCSSLLLEITTVICGLILPRLIIQAYGSEVNGLVNSVRQFLSVVTFLESGMGAVVRSALYKPLTESDANTISKIISSAGKFFRRIAKILFCYIIILIAIYPVISESKFDREFISLIIIAISINSFAQYYIGIVDGMILVADQRGYVLSFAKILAVILNAIVCSVLINNGLGIHTVQFTTAAIYLARPILIRIYVKKHYSINYHAKYDHEPIAQKWNGVAQHIAAIVLEGTDILVLTVFSTLANVSIYSVYFLVISGIKQLFSSISEGFQALMGELYVKKDEVNMRKMFDLMEWLYGTTTTFVYGCTAFLIIPFVAVYTMNVNDADYYCPLFAVLIVIAFWIYNNNSPYHIAILAAGHYRQTQKYFIIAAAINVIISVTTVSLFGLIGVAIGTLAAMLFQTTWMIIYNVKHISKRPVKLIMKQFATDGIIIIISSSLSSFIKFGAVSWRGWMIMGLKIAIIWGMTSLVVNLICFKNVIAMLIPGRVRSRLRRIKSSI